MTISWLWTSSEGNHIELCDMENYFVTRGARGGKMPPYRVGSVGLPDGSGEIISSVSVNARELDVPLTILGDNLADVDTLSSQLASYLSPRNGDGTLHVTRSNGVSRILTCRYVGGLDGAQPDGIAAIKATLQFKAVDPYWYSTTPVTGSQAKVGGGGGWLPPVPIRLSESAVFASPTITNHGDDVAWPIWTITGPMTKIILRNVSTGDNLGIDCPLLAGEKLFIDTRPGKKTIVDVNNVNKFGFIHPGQASLGSFKKGANVVNIYMDGATVGSLVAWSFQERYFSY